MNKNPEKQPDQKGSRRNQRGFTLMELLISLGFVASMAGLISGSSFLAIRTRVESGAIADIAVETARTTRWLVRDVHRSASSGLADPATGATSASFTWDNGGPVTCTYSLTGTDLIRDCGAIQSTVGKYINNLTFDRAGNLITARYTIIPPSAPDRSQLVDMNMALGGG